MTTQRRDSRIRILQVAHTRGYGGLERQVLALSTGLREAGHSVLMAAPRGSWLARHADRAGIRSVAVRFRGLGDPLSHWSIQRIAHSENVDIIHGHSRRSAFYSGLGARLGRRHSVATVHSLGTWKGYRLNERVIAVSAAVRGFLEERGLPTGRIRLVHNGVESGSTSVDREEARTRIGLTRDRFGVAMVGRMVSHKGHDLLIEALARLGPRFAHVDACFVGHAEGEWCDSLRAQAERLGLSRRIRFVGYQDDVPAVLDAMDLFVLPSRIEALSLSLLEAMAAGLPVVAARTGGVPEVIEDGRNGLLFPAGNAEALAHRLRSLVGDSDRRRRLGTLARSTVREKFSAQAMIRQTELVYGELTGREDR